MNSEEQHYLSSWTERLSAELGIDNRDFRAAVNIDRLLDLAGVAAHTVLRPAAPVTTFLVGYAAGLAAAGGTKPSEAIRSADSISRSALAAERTTNRGNADQPDATH